MRETRQLVVYPMIHEEEIKIKNEKTRKRNELNSEFSTAIFGTRALLAQNIKCSDDENKDYGLGSGYQDKNRAGSSVRWKKVVEMALGWADEMWGKSSEGNVLRLEYHRVWACLLLLYTVPSIHLTLEAARVVYSRDTSRPNSLALIQSTVTRTRFRAR